MEHNFINGKVQVGERNTGNKRKELALIELKGVRVGEEVELE